MTGADLAGADLRGARFERCDLTEVELRDARLAGAAFDGCRLGGVRGALSLRGTRMRWDDLLELAPAFAGELGIELIADE
jgi:uncharacterized protein YjbI with pentapeptide repeats